MSRVVSVGVLDLELDPDGVDRQRVGAVNEPFALRLDGLPGRERGLDVGERSEVLVCVLFPFFGFDLGPRDDPDDRAALQTHGPGRGIYRLHNAYELGLPLEIS